MSRTVIDPMTRARYDHGQTGSESEVYMNRPRRDVSSETLRARLAAGEWLAPGEVAALFGKKRHSAINWIKQGKIGYRKDPNGYRECDPADVRVLLAEYDQTRRDGTPAE